MQTKQYAKQNKTHTRIQDTKAFFCGGRIFRRKCSKSSVFIDSIIGTVLNKSVVFLMRYKYLKRDSNNTLKQISYLLTIKFRKKVDVN